MRQQTSEPTSQKQNSTIKTDNKARALKYQYKQVVEENYITKQGNEQPGKQRRAKESSQKAARR